MSAYHQMGHDSESMILELELNRFKGVILSPVNYNPGNTVDQCKRFRKDRGDLDIVFDPQLYFPVSECGKLPKWSYFPKDLDTREPSVPAWQKIVDKVLVAVKDFSPNGICSPAAIPRTFSDEYYDAIVTVANYMSDKLGVGGCRPIITALVGLTDLGRNERYLSVASILGKFRGRGVYLVLTDDQPPRLERTDTGALEGAARLIRLLVGAGYDVTVGFTSSEMLLWKAAGAQNIASGKFFNLRRFTLGRWDEDAKKGGKSMWYWFEPSLLAFLREADLRRFMRELPISESHASNPYSQIILEKLRGLEQAPWLADSWRQFLCWFAHCESDVGNDIHKAGHMLEHAAGAWKQVGEMRLKFEDERNNGAWVRAWEIVLNELARRPD